MPSRSNKQRRFLEHKFGHAWVKRHHFDKVKKSKKRKR
jgi:hypothetical protein